MTHAFPQTSSSTLFNSYSETEEPPHPDAPLSEAHASFLSEYLNPVYLQEKNLEALASRFADESSLQLYSFLCEPLAQKLELELRKRDAEDGLGKSRHGHVPPHTAGTGAAWSVKGPPHKSRYCVLGAPDPTPNPEMATPYAPGTTDIVRTLQEQLFPSAAFRAWLAHVSRLLPMRYAVEARRFRPGLDYTLATSEDEVRMDVVLGLTPPVEVTKSRQTKVKEGADAKGWDSGEWGGWEVCVFGLKGLTVVLTICG